MATLIETFGNLNKALYFHLFRRIMGIK